MMRLLIGGSPCTHWSIAQTKNRETKPDGLGWELFKNYLIALEKYAPDFFLYENNKSMSAAIREQITRELGVKPIEINSAQSRKRLYWTNIPGVELPEDRGILLRDILESGIVWKEKAYCLAANRGGHCLAHDIEKSKYDYVAEPILVGKPLTDREMEYMVREVSGGRNHFDFDFHHDATKEKSSCVTANTHRGVPYNVLAEPVRIGTIESDAKNADFDSQQYRVYSPDGKSVTICGQGGGVGAKTGLYAVPVKEKKVGVLPNGVGELTQCQSKRIYSVDAKGRVLNAGPGGLGVQTGLYAVPCAGRMVGRRINADGHRDGYNEDIQRHQRFELNTNPQKTNCLSPVEKDNLVIETADGKTYPAYEVRDGQITIKGMQYPIKLADGYYIIRKLTVTECKRLQTVPGNYVFPVSDTQAYKMLGNGWTVDVIAHILHYASGISEEPLEVLSMYDGMSCGRLALNKLGAHVTKYYATEIDKYAIKTTQHNFPDTIQLGDAFQVRDDSWAL